MSGINSRHIFSYTKVMQIKHKIKLAANKFRLQSIIFPSLLSTGNCKIINLSEENILWGFKI